MPHKKQSKYLPSPQSPPPLYLGGVQRLQCLLLRHRYFFGQQLNQRQNCLCRKRLSQGSVTVSFSLIFIPHNLHLSTVILTLHMLLLSKMLLSDIVVCVSMSVLQRWFVKNEVPVLFALRSSLSTDATTSMSNVNARLGKKNIIHSSLNQPWYAEVNKTASSHDHTTLVLEFQFPVFPMISSDAKASPYWSWISTFKLPL